MYGINQKAYPTIYSELRPVKSQSICPIECEKSTQEAMVAFSFDFVTSTIKTVRDGLPSSLLPSPFINDLPKHVDIDPIALNGGRMTNCFINSLKRYISANMKRKDKKQRTHQRTNFPCFCSWMRYPKIISNYDAQWRRFVSVFRGVDGDERGWGRTVTQYRPIVLFHWILIFSYFSLFVEMREVNWKNKISLPLLVVLSSRPSQTFTNVYISRSLVGTYMVLKKNPCLRKFIPSEIITLCYWICSVNLDYPVLCSVAPVGIHYCLISRWFWISWELK